MIMSPDQDGPRVERWRRAFDRNRPVLEPAGNPGAGDPPFQRQPRRTLRGQRSAEWITSPVINRACSTH
jgi:hypothetical protein